MTRIEEIGDATLYLGDCLKVMPTLDPVDMVLADPPYGTTACKWDAVIPLDDMWAAMLARKGAPVVMMAGQPFTSALIMSNPKQFKMSWVWNKRFGANFGMAKYHPMKIHEDVVVFCNGTATYNPQMVKRDIPIKLGKNVSKSGSANLAHAKPEYEGKVYDEKYPESIICYSCRAEGQIKEHPTQKPVALMEYLIRTYTNEEDTVLDFVMGSGTTGVACFNLKRKFIGIELNEKYFEIACDRISKGRLIDADK